MTGNWRRFGQSDVSGGLQLAQWSRTGQAGVGSRKGRDHESVSGSACLLHPDGGKYHLKNYMFGFKNLLREGSVLWELPVQTLICIAFCRVGRISPVKIWLFARWRFYLFGCLQKWCWQGFFWKANASLPCGFTLLAKHSPHWSDCLLMSGSVQKDASQRRHVQPGGRHLFSFNACVQLLGGSSYEWITSTDLIWRPCFIVFT